MAKLIVVFKSTGIMPLSFDTDDYNWNYSGNGNEKIFYKSKEDYYEQ